MAIPTAPPKNIWVAAGDGDLARVQVNPQSAFPRTFRLTPRPCGRNSSTSTAATSPNTPDPFTYTPMHAAASYGHLDVLEYLISRGGDVNVTDSDGDTPLYTVENIETARFLVDRGAVVDHRNSDGISPIEHLAEDFPSVARFLESLSPSVPNATATADAPTPPSQHHQNAVSEQLTSELMASVQDIMQRAEAEGRDPDEELRQVVSRTVLEGVVSGFEMTTTPGEEQRGPANDSPAKRPKTDDGPG